MASDAYKMFTSKSISAPTTSSSDAYKMFTTKSISSPSVTSQDAYKMFTSTPTAYTGTTTAAKKKDEYMTGGLLSKAFDVIQTPQYALTGALSPDYTVGEAIKKRITPGEATGLYDLDTGSDTLDFAGKVAGFALDVVADPINFLGIGAVTKVTKGLKALKGADTVADVAKVMNKYGDSADFLKAVKAGEQAAATIGGAAAKGQKSLISLVNPLTGTEIMPLVKGKGALEGITKGIGKVTGAGTDLAKLEKAAKTKQIGKAGKLKATGTARLVQQKINVIAAKAEKRLGKLKATKDELADMTEKYAGDASIKLRKGLEKEYEEFAKVADDLSKQMKDLGLPQLEGKKLQNTLTNALRKKFSRQGETVKAAKETLDVGGEIGAEQMAQYTGFKTASGKTTLFGEASGKSGAKLYEADGTAKNLVSVGEKGDELVYSTKKMANQIKDAGYEAAVANKGKAESVKNKAMKAARASKLEELRKANPEEFFTRVGMSPKQTNKALAKLGKEVEFAESPWEIIRAEAATLGALTARKTFSDEMVRTGMGRKLAKGEKIPEGFVRGKIKGLEDLIFEKDVYGELEKLTKVYSGKSGIESVNTFLDIYDGVQNGIKANLTFINLPFHTRNVVSNHWNMFLAGLNNPAAHLKGYNVSRKISKAIRKGDDLGKYLKGDDLKYAKEMVEELGLLNTGAFTVDIDDTLIGLLKIAQNTPLHKAGGYAGEVLENAAKISTYIAKRKSGLGMDDAAMEVRKYLFDYSDLTNTERAVLKRLMPFYTWTRNNLPLQAAMLIQKPGKASIISKAKNAIEESVSGKPMDSNSMPDWLEEAYPIYIGQKGGLQSYIKMEGFLPTVDLNKLGRPGEAILEQLSFMIKTPAELIMNYDTFLERDIKEYEGQKEFLGIPFTDKGVYVHPYTDKLIRTLFRPAGEAQKLVKDPTKKIQPTDTQMWINALLGKTYQYDPKQQKEYSERSLDREVGKLEDAIDDAKKRGHTSEVKRLQEEIKKLKKEGYNL